MNDSKSRQDADSCSKLDTRHEEDTTAVLSDAQHAKLQKRYDEGNALLSEVNIEQAALKFEEALSMLPKPRQQWSAAVQLWAALGDARLELGDIQGAFEAFRDAAATSQGAANPYVLFRSGALLAAMDREAEGAEDSKNKEVIALIREAMAGTGSR